jgi:hypothetical protein
MNRAFIAIAALATFAGVYVLTPPPAGSAAPEPEPQASVYYPGCSAVRAAGRAPLYRGQPGYREGMDGDDDGIACEPWQGRRLRGRQNLRTDSM